MKAVELSFRPCHPHAGLLGAMASSSAGDRSPSVSTTGLTADDEVDDAHAVTAFFQPQGPMYYMDAAPPVGGSASGDVARGIYGRVVREPYLARDDVGSYGLYVGNWGGNSSITVIRHHIWRDLILRCPAQILVAQEVTGQFARLLQNPEHLPRELTQPASAVVEPWKVVVGPDVETRSTLVVAGRSSLVAGIDLLAWRSIFDGDYRKGPGRRGHAYSRLLVAKVVWKKPMAGRAELIILNVHMHPQTAKKAKGFHASHFRLFDMMDHLMRAHDVDIIAGDFNMALWRFAPEMRNRRHTITAMAWYAWGLVGEAPTVVEQTEKKNTEEEAAGSTETEAAGAASSVEGEVPKPRCDSLGIFCARPLEKMLRSFPDDLFDPKGPQVRLHRYAKGQGYPIDTYVGGLKSMRETLREPHAPAVAGTAWPKSNQKKIDPGQWDPQDLFSRGAHMPLIIWVGDKPRRTEKALVKREWDMEARNWGPWSENRSKLMQQQGRGPPPGRRETAPAVAETWSEQPAASRQDWSTWTASSWQTWSEQPAASRQDWSSSSWRDSWSEENTQTATYTSPVGEWFWQSDPWPRDNSWSTWNTGATTPGTWDNTWQRSEAWDNTWQSPWSWQ